PIPPVTRRVIMAHRQNGATCKHRYKVGCHRLAVWRRGRRWRLGSTLWVTHGTPRAQYIYSTHTSLLYASSTLLHLQFHYDNFTTSHFPNENGSHCASRFLL